MLRTLRFLPLVALGISLGGCLGDDPVAPRIEDTEFASSLGVNLAASTRSQSGLYYRDLTVGTGALANYASAVSVRYSGRLSNGNLFDPGPGPLDFNIGAGEYIPGFEEGIIGMRVGGRRQLIVPPHLAYGSQPRNGLPGNSILVFTVELMSVGGGA